MNNKNAHAYVQEVVDVIFTQMYSKKGIKLFGERDIAEIIKESRKLDKGVMPGKPVVIQLKPDEIIDVERRQSIEAVNIIKEQINGIIKGRTCANGIKQKSNLKEVESVASPTIFLEGLFTTLVINSYEGREVATFDVPVAYLHADMPKDKKFLLKFRGTFVDVMCQINP